MEMSEIYNGSQWAHDIFLVNKAGATEYIMGLSSTLVMCSLPLNNDGKISPICYFSGTHILVSSQNHL